MLYTENDQCISTKWFTYQGLIQHLKGSKKDHHPYGWFHFAILTYLSNVYMDYYPAMDNNPSEKIHHIMHYHSSHFKNKRQAIKNHMIRYIEYKFVFDMESIINEYNQKQSIVPDKGSASIVVSTNVVNVNLSSPVKSPRGMVVKCANPTPIQNNSNQYTRHDRNAYQSTTRYSNYSSAHRNGRFDHYGPSSNFKPSHAQDYINSRSRRSNVSSSRRQKPELAKVSSFSFIYFRKS